MKALFLLKVRQLSEAKILEEFVEFTARGPEDSSLFCKIPGWSAETEIREQPHPDQVRLLVLHDGVGQGREIPQHGEPDLPPLDELALAPPTVRRRRLQARRFHALFPIPVLRGGVHR